MPKLTLNYCSIADVEIVEPKPENATADPNDGQQTETETNNQKTN